MKTKSIIIGEEASLFLDRDGVINKRLVDEYVLNPEQFDLLPGVAKAIKKFRSLFGHIFVVTNQQGIGKGLMTHEDLKQVHQKFHLALEEVGASVDKIYYCPNKLEDNHIDRKPNVGMGLKARKEFKINLKKATMVGDALSDMMFGRKLGMCTVFISSDLKVVQENAHLIDFWFDSLASFAKSLK